VDVAFEVAGMRHGYLHIVVIGFLAVIIVTGVPEALREAIFAAPAPQGFILD
jgi:hypothetical protein